MQKHKFVVVGKDTYSEPSNNSISFKLALKNYSEFDYSSKLDFLGSGKDQEVHYQFLP